MIDIVWLFRYNENVYIEDIENIYRDENCCAVLGIGMVEIFIMSFLLEIQMQEYMTIKEIFEKWKIVDRRINTLCLEERVDGAMKFGREWAITKNVTKPNDARIKSGKYVKRKAGAIL